MTTQSDYTPDTEEVREDFTCAVYEGISSRRAVEDANFEWDRRAAQFDRWLAEHDRQIAEAAWDKGVSQGVKAHCEQGCSVDYDKGFNPHRKEPE